MTKDKQYIILREIAWRIADGAMLSAICETCECRNSNSKSYACPNCNFRQDIAKLQNELGISKAIVLYDPITDSIQLSDKIRLITDLWLVSWGYGQIIRENEETKPYVPVVKQALAEYDTWSKSESESQCKIQLAFKIQEYIKEAAKIG